jgi:UDP-3-O-[3-hydroxymyristoyl] glucosamine N-acyltransferase
VEIEDDVEIGANACVDRAALGVTRIGKGTKLDNLVHVGHNCLIGKHVVIAAQTGFSGSVVVEDYATIGGQVGVGEKATIQARAIVGGGSGILTSAIVHAGEPVWGMPARPLRKHLKGLAYTQKVPELEKQIRQLKQQIARIEAAGKEKGYEPGK